MAQDLSDVFKRGAVAEHPGGQGMSKQVRALEGRIEFGTCVLVLPQRQTALVAKQAAQLAILSGNRFRMGIGVGWNTVEFEALDVPFEHRGARQAEQVELMRRLWTEDSLTFKGDYHTVTQASILPRPTRPVPIWFGGGAPSVLRRCGRLGDGWVPVGVPNEKSRGTPSRLHTLPRGSKNPAMILPVSSLKYV